MLEDLELFLSDKIVTIIISFVTVQSFCIVRMVVEKRSKFLSSQKVRILLRKTRRNAMAVLEVKELTKKYGEGESEVIALDHVSFSVERGEFVAIIGASGSGKSTLMNMIGGIDYPTSGSIIIDGNEIQAMSEDELAIFRRRNLGIVYQFYNLIPILNVEENMAIPMELDGRKVEKAQMDDMLLRLGLTERRTHLPNELSGGQQQRTSIGRALITRPSIVLADVN